MKKIWQKYIKIVGLVFTSALTATFGAIVVFGIISLIEYVKLKQKAKK
ncbi:hypothetical protein KAR50_01080 [Periweissella fabaria]|nr:hypothetical protein [Periweissella fabaria]MCM0596439.1 hypothetical protein [Periweissella fabaria]